MLNVSLFANINLTVASLSLFVGMCCQTSLTKGFSSFFRHIETESCSEFGQQSATRTQILFSPGC